MNKSFLKKSGSILMAFVLSCSVFTFPASAKTEADYEKEIAKLEQQIAANQGNVEITEQNIKDILKQMDLMQEQLNVYNDKIAELSRQIAEKDKIIGDFQNEIDSLLKEISNAEKKQGELENQIASTYELLGERMRSVYMAGETSTVEILLASKGFDDFLTRLELLRRISRRDTDMVSGLQTSINDYEALKTKLANDKTSVEDKQNAVKEERSAINEVRSKEQSTRNILNSKQNTLEARSNNLSAYQQKLEKNDASLNQQLEKAREEYDNFKASQMEGGSGSLEPGGNSQFTQSSRGMIFPLQYPSAYINQPFTWNGKTGHKGVDMRTSGGGGNTYGKEIRAAADGVVSTAEYHYSWGNNVYINHGNGVYTRYAHCSRMLVSHGQHVKQGQVIALVGNTGNVYPQPTPSNPHAGAHLHFEVYVNKTRVNPASWIPSGPDK